MYSKLKYINVPKNENDIKSLLGAKDKQTIIFGGDSQENYLALNEVLEYIKLNSIHHTKTSYKTLLDRFSKAPYGFIADDIAWLIASLFKSGDADLFMNTEHISLQNKKTDEILAYLTKISYADKLLIEKREKATEKQFKSVKNVMSNLFKTSEMEDNEDSILDLFRTKADKVRSSLNDYKKEMDREPRLPGRSVVENGTELMLSISRISFTTELFEVIDKNQDKLLDFADDLEPIQIFFDGDQVNIFKRAIRVTDLYNDSKTFIAGNSEIEVIVGNIIEIIKMSHPYGEVHKLPDLITNFTRLYGTILENGRTPLLEAIDDAKEHVLNVLSTKDFKGKFEREFERKFEEIKNKTFECRNVSSLQSINSEIHVLEMNMLNEIMEEDKKQIKAAPVDGIPGSPDVVSPTRVNIKKYKNISIKDVDSNHSWRIETAEDVDKYVAQLREKLMKELRKDEDTILNVLF